jgi:hypothetical protein
MTLTEEQINRIAKLVDNGKVTSPALRDDLIDHICCEVESRITSGSSFDESLQLAISDVAPKGLKEIQRLSNILLQTKTQINMKRLTYVIGMLTAMMMSFGWLLNILRMGEIGNIIFAFGALGFVTLFLPLIGYDYFKNRTNKKLAEKIRTVSGLLSVIMIGIAVLFKIMHMPGADEVLMAGGVIFTFGFLPPVFFILYKKSLSETEG